MIYETTNAKALHEIMIAAFEETRSYPIASSALDETVNTIEIELSQGAKGFIVERKGKPVAGVRVKLEDDAIYFYRLSVLPSERGKGHAKKLLQHIEKYAQAFGHKISRCKVRVEVERNIDLYNKYGYAIKESSIVSRGGVKIPTVTMEKEL